MSSPATSILSVLVQIKEALDEANRINKKIAEELGHQRRAASPRQDVIKY